MLEISDLHVVRPGLSLAALNGSGDAAGAVRSLARVFAAVDAIA
jgi:hypothetical protein